MKTKKTALRMRDRLRAPRAMPRAVKVSTNSYWKARGITEKVNTRMAQEDRRSSSSLRVKIMAK